MSIDTALATGHCVGGGLLPDWLPRWLWPWLAGSQGIETCGIEWLMLLEGLAVLVVLLAMLRALSPMPRAEQLGELGEASVPGHRATPSSLGEIR